MSDAAPYVAFWLAVAIVVVAFLYYDDKQEQRDHEIKMKAHTCQEQVIEE